MPRILLTLSIVLFVSVYTSQAQRYMRVSKFRLSGGPALGTASNYNDPADGKAGVGINLGMEYVFHKQFSGALSYTYFFTGSDIVKYFGVINLDGRYYFLSEKRDSKVYLLLGLGNAKTVTKEPVVNGTIDREDAETGLNLGLGYNHAFSKEWGYNVQAKYLTALEGQLVFNIGLIRSF